MTKQEQNKFFSQIAANCKATGNYGHCSPMTELAIRCAADVMTDTMPEDVRNRVMLGLCGIAITGMTIDRTMEMPGMPDEPSYIDYLQAIQELLQAGIEDEAFRVSTQAALDALKQVLWNYSA